jgi:hypothetical protein
MMVRRFLKLAFPLTVLSVAAILLIHARPYDNAELRAFLLPPEGCPAPCWQGIRPGVTTMAQAAILLEQARTIEYDVYPGSIQGEGVIHWRTSDRPVRGSIRFIRGIVENVQIEGLQMVEVWLLLGPPDRGEYLDTYVFGDSNTGSALPFIHIVYYPGYGISASANTDCVRFWQQFAHVVISATSLPEHVEANPPSLSSYRQRACEQARKAQGI